MRIALQLVLGVGRKALMTAAEVNGPGGDDHPHRPNRDTHRLAHRATGNLRHRAAGASAARRTTTPPASFLIMDGGAKRVGAEIAGSSTASALLLHRQRGEVRRGFDRRHKPTIAQRPAARPSPAAATPMSARDIHHPRAGIEALGRN